METLHQQQHWTTLSILIEAVALVWLAAGESNTVSSSIRCWDSVGIGLSCITRIPKAETRVEEEQSRTAAEIQAFETFATQISNLELPPHAGQLTPAHGQTMTAGSPSTSGVKMKRIRYIYRDTVMTTPHYSEDYNDTLRVSVSEEFSPELASTLIHGDELTAPLQQALLEASQTAISDRTSYQKLLEEEYEHLQTATHRLQVIANALEQIHNQVQDPQQFSDLIDAYDRLQTLRTDCRDLLDIRQSLLNDLPQDGSGHFFEYLYREYPWTYPVLADTLDCRTRVQQLEQDLTDVISRYS